MAEETVGAMPVVPSKRLRALGPKVVPIHQLEEWFADSIEAYRAAGAGKLAISIAKDNLVWSLIRVIQSSIELAEHDGIDKNQLKLVLAPDTYSTAIVQLIDLQIIRPVMQDMGHGAMTLGGVSVIKKEGGKNFLYIPFHHKIELVIND